MVRRVLPSLIVVLVFSTIAHAQNTETKPLEGRWMVTGGEHGGKPMDSLKGGVMNITGNAFEIRTASGNMLKGTLQLDTSKAPNKSTGLRPLTLTADERRDLIAFLESLTDRDLLHDPRWSNPWK